MGCASFAQLFENGSCCQLATLDLSYNGIGHEGVVYNAMDRLEAINCYSCCCYYDEGFFDPDPFPSGVRTLVRVWQTVELPPDLQVHIMGNGISQGNQNHVPARCLGQVLVGSKPYLTSFDDDTQE